jgi:hypothetical protein
MEHPVPAPDIFCVTNIFKYGFPNCASCIMSNVNRELLQIQKLAVVDCLKIQSNPVITTSIYATPRL